MVDSPRSMGDSQLMVDELCMMNYKLQIIDEFLIWIFEQDD